VCTASHTALAPSQERAWYDSHREQILNSGGRHQAGDTCDGSGDSPDENLELSRFCQKSAYSGYTDAAGAFYRVFEALFEKLAAQEATAFDRQRATAEKLEPPTPAPPFGSSHAPEADVKAFYAFWVNFQSVKDFAWADVHNPASAPSRKIRRLMDDENAKQRRAAKSAFVSEVRALAEHVRRKDRRMLRFQARNGQGVDSVCVHLGCS